MTKSIQSILFALVLTIVVAFLFVGGAELSSHFDRDEIGLLVANAGIAGPILIIVLMIIAVIASPLPSAPIALAAGAAYGHYVGTIYVAIGAELGAIIAFLIARFLGRKTVSRWLGDAADHGLLGSQNALTMIVFTSRLLPFVSFDVMSYAAGLSNLQIWRFSLATFAGIIPASFVLAHFGGEALSGEFGTKEWLTLVLGLLTAIPLVIIALKRQTKDSRQGKL